MGDIEPYEEGTVLIGNALFVDRAKGDYRLQGDSPAVDQGYDMGLDHDIENADRPQGDGYDLGAYEYAPQNRRPTAKDDSYVTRQDESLAFAAPGVLDNDEDGDGDANGDALTAVLASAPAYGQLALNADGSFTYTPDEDFAGEDSFAYQADDGAYLSDEVTVRIRVLAEQAPEEPLVESLFLPVFVR